MSQKSSGPLSKFNLALALLWLVDVAVTVAGYLILTSSNATQAEFYTSQSADYGAYFTAQSGSTLGATLIGAGVIGFMITLAAHVVSRSIAKNTAASVAPATARANEPDFDFEDIDFDDKPTTTATGTAGTAEETTPSAIAEPAEPVAVTAAASSTDADAPAGSPTPR
jgi:hypothetical protein